MCSLKLDTTICLSCHNNNHVNGIIASFTIGLSTGALMLTAKVIQVGLIIVG